MNTAATSAEQYWHIHRSDCRTTLISPHTSSAILPTFDIIVGTLMLSAPESREFVELLLLHICTVMSCLFLNAHFVFLLETTLSDSHTLDQPVTIFTCQFCTTTSTMLTALRRLEFAVARFCYLTLKQISGNSATLFH